MHDLHLRELFHDSMGGGAWAFLVGGLPDKHCATLLIPVRLLTSPVVLHHAVTPKPKFVMCMQRLPNCNQNQVDNCSHAIDVIGGQKCRMPTANKVHSAQLTTLDHDLTTQLLFCGMEASFMQYMASCGEYIDLTLLTRWSNHVGQIM